MQTWIISIFALYGVATIWIHLCRALHAPIDQSAKCFYVYTHHSQNKIEWIIRTLTYMSKTEGREIMIFVIDSGSEDDTIKILERFSKNGVYIKCLKHIPQEIYYDHKHHRQVIDLREGSVLAN